MIVIENISSKNLADPYEYTHKIENENFCYISIILKRKIINLSKGQIFHYYSIQTHTNPPSFRNYPRKEYLSRLLFESRKIRESTSNDFNKKFDS